jgi:hypothetical protein
MATTAYSQRYAREIDVEQLAWLLSGRQPIAAEQVPEIDPKWSDWIRSDIKCSSCGGTGAHVVRSARARGTQKLIRQSHFRLGRTATTRIILSVNSMAKMMACSPNLTGS